MLVYVQRDALSGHRATPRWTIHRNYGGTTRCGRYIGQDYLKHGPGWPRPQGEVKVCSRCIGPNERKALEEQL